MATGGGPEKRLELYGRILVNIHDTLCNNVNVKQVSAMLQDKENASKSAKKNMRKVAKLNDPEIFYGVLRKFDFQSFVAFVEVVRDSSSKDDKHYQLLSVICSNFKHLNKPSDPDSLESYSKLMDIIAQHEKKSSHVTISYKKDDDDDDVGTVTGEWTDVTSKVTSTMKEVKLEDDPVISLLDLKMLRHDVEDEPLEFSQDEGVFYSHTHGVRVTANRQALPNDSLHIFLTVNDYSRMIKIPDGYDASFSALISLTCQPEIDTFREFVSITIPHCACGDIEESLCVLSASEPSGSDKIVCLQEDSDIEIEDIDDCYFSFRTRHFTKYKVASNTRGSRKQKASKKNPMKSGHSALAVKKNRSLERSSSFPESKMEEESVEFHLQVNNKFVAVRGVPTDIDTSSLIRNYFFVAKAASDTYIEELDKLVLKKWGKSFRWIKSLPFQFKEEFIIFDPEEIVQDGWKLICNTPPPAIRKTDVLEYFDRATNAPSLPYIPYSMSTIDGTPRTTDFKIVARGSVDCVTWRREVELRFFVEPNAASRSTVANTDDKNVITIIRDMYGRDSSILEAINGRGNQELELTLESYECCLLLCEISFHLPNWFRLASLLGFNQHEIQHFKDSNNTKYAFEAAYNMLSLWITRADPFKTFRTLVVKLRQCNTELKEGTWKLKSCTDGYVIHIFNERRLSDISRKIVMVWKFVARLVGMKDSTIDEVELDHKSMKERERAYQMLWEWKRTSENQNECELNEKLFKALQCIQYHTGQLRDCLTSFYSSNS